LLAGVQVVIAKTDDDYDLQRALCIASTVCKEHYFKRRVSLKKKSWHLREVAALEQTNSRKRSNRMNKRVKTTRKR
jgi:hypothetical protein